MNGHTFKNFFNSVKMAVYPGQTLSVEILFFAALSDKDLPTFIDTSTSLILLTERGVRVVLSPRPWIVKLNPKILLKF